MTDENSDEAYQTIAEIHSDVNTYVERQAAEAREVAAIQEGIDAYRAGDHRPLEEIGKQREELFGIDRP